MLNLFGLFQVILGLDQLLELELLFELREVNLVLCEPLSTLVPRLAVLVVGVILLYLIEIFVRKMLVCDDSLLVFPHLILLVGLFQELKNII